MVAINEEKHGLDKAIEMLTAKVEFKNDEEKLTYVKEIIKAISEDEDLKACIQNIEYDPFPTTQYNYGRYMAILSNLSKSKAQLMALGMLEAGANANGVVWAVRILYGE